MRDILDAIARVEQHTEGLTLDAFRADRSTGDAVAMNVAIIGEAAGQMPDEAAALCPSVP